MKSYKTSKIWIGLIVIGCIVPVFLVLPTFVTHPDYLTNWTVIITFLILFLLILYPIGRYVSLDHKNLCHFDFFIFKKCLPIESIQRITYPKTFIVGTANRTLTIQANIQGIYKDITLPNPAFQKQILAKIVRDLQIINSNIRIDVDVENLLQEYNNLQSK